MEDKEILSFEIFMEQLRERTDRIESMEREMLKYLDYNKIKKPLGLWQILKNKFNEIKILKT